MKTPAGPAIIFRTSPWALPQKEQKVILEALAMTKRGLGKRDSIVLALDHLIDEAVFLGFRGGHVVVSVGILLQLLNGLAAMLGENFVDRPAPAQNLLGGD